MSSPASPSWDGGSLRDPSGRIWIENNRIFRVLTAEGAGDWKDFLSIDIASELTNQKQLIGAETRLPAELPENLSQWVAVNPASAHLVLEHPAIPLVSYPYEWPFEMLKRAALLKLSLLDRLLERSFTLKDGAVANVQFWGMTPVFVDTASITRWKGEAVWLGYNLFCRTALYPLMIEAHLGLPFQRLLRGAPSGIAPAAASRILGWRNAWRRGVLLHAHLHASLEKSWHNPGMELRAEIRSTAASTASLRKMVERLQKCVESLRTRHRSDWQTYPTDCLYDEAARQEKVRVVRECLSSGRKRHIVWDVGANVGDYTILSAAHANWVVALDADAAAVQQLARRIEQAGITNVLPLVMDFANPSPGGGWLCKETKGLLERGRPDLLLALAVIHHLSLGAGIRLPEVVSMLAAISSEAIIEFVDPEDPSCKELLIATGVVRQDYSRDAFESCVTRYWKVSSVSDVTPTRRIYHLVSSCP
jgi:ribosomal protein L11 methylase PrmA